MATILDSKKSTTGSPYIFYTVEVTATRTSASKASLSVEITSDLEYSSSSKGTGYTMTGKLYVGGSWHSITLKKSTVAWSGANDPYTATATITVSGLSNSQTSLTGVKFKVESSSSSYPGGELTSTSCSNISVPAWTSYTVSYNANGGSGAPSAQTKYKGVNLTLRSDEPTKEGYNFLGWATSSTASSPAYYPGGLFTTDATTTLYAVWESANNKSTITLSKSNAVLGETIRVNLKILDATNTHEIVWTSGSNSYTSHTSATSSVDVVLSESVFSSWFGSTDKYISVNVTVTTYDSSGTSLGSATAELTLKLIEEIAKPSTPIATVVRNAEGAVITLTQPTFEYGATFSEWEVTTNEGALSVSGDTVTATIEEVINKNHIATIRAIDSRGFASDPIYVAWYLRKKGVCVFKDGFWTPANSIAYTNGAWDYKQAYVYVGENWKAIR